MENTAVANVEKSAVRTLSLGLVRFMLLSAIPASNPNPIFPETYR